MKSVYSAVLVSLAFSSVSLSANAQIYSWSDLGVGTAVAVNNGGQTVGESNGQATLWTGTTATYLGLGAAVGINNSGQIVGNSNGQATLWHEGTTTILGDFRAQAINNLGQVAGEMGNAPFAVVWNGSTVSPLEPEGTALMHVLAMNDTGQVAGWGRTFGTGVNQARVVDDGIGIRLQSFPNAGFPDGAAYDVNNDGKLVGYVWSPKQITAVYWEGTTPVDLGSLPDHPSFSDSQAYGINNPGQIVGFSVTGTPGNRHATLWDDGAIYDLNSFLDASTAAAGWVLETATDISDTGWIVGEAFNTISGERHAYVLAPVPEPEIYALMGVGLAGLGLVRRRRNRTAPIAAAHSLPSPV